MWSPRHIMQKTPKSHGKWTFCLRGHGKMRRLVRIGDGNHNELKVEDDRVERRVVVEPGASKQLAVNLQPASWIF